VLSRCLDVTKTMFYLIVFNKKKENETSGRTDGRGSCSAENGSLFFDRAVWLPLPAGWVGRAG
jgi:hypothetical protein